MIFIYQVDDLIVFAKQEFDTSKLVFRLSKKIELKCLGRLRKFLGIEFDWSESEALGRQQTSLINKVLSTIGIDQAKAVQNPVDPSFCHEDSVKSKLLGPDNPQK